MNAKFFIFLLAFAITSCSYTQCRRKEQLPEAPTQKNISDNLEILPRGQKPPTIYVFRYDGSLQCGQGQAIAPEEMGKRLQGIPIYRSFKKNDGQMHIQVCGSNTGMANVFEIPKKNLEKALNKGFKLWNFR